MDVFKFILFGLVGLSMIFWVCVIALWHTYTFPRLFNEDNNSIETYKGYMDSQQLSQTGLINRGKYSMQSFVIADFNPVEEAYSVNRLYTLMLISLGFMSFLLITYGLHSGFTLYGIN